MKTIKNRNVNGRPKKSATEKKSYKVTVKLATAEYYSLKSKAKEASDTISNFIRNAILRSEVKQRLDATHLRHILQLTGMANNLNQIARKANSVGYLKAKMESETLAKSIDNIIKSIEYDD